MSSFSIRLREERERLGLTQPDFGALGGVGKQSQINYESGKRLPDVSYLTALGGHGVDVAYLLTGVESGFRLLPGGGFEVPDLAGALLQHAVRAARPTIAKIQAQMRDYDPADQSDKDLTPDPTAFAVIPLHAASLAAGLGANNDHEGVIDHLAFSRAWLKRIGVGASNAVLARADGESMAPTIQDGDLLLIDRSRRDVPVRSGATVPKRPPAIYALLEDGAARVKRLARPEAGILVLASDNPAHPPEVLSGREAERLTIIGRVMWWGHTDRE